MARQMAQSGARDSWTRASLHDRRQPIRGNGRGSSRSVGRSDAHRSLADRGGIADRSGSFRLRKRSSHV